MRWRASKLVAHVRLSVCVMPTNDTRPFPHTSDHIFFQLRLALVCGPVLVMQACVIGVCFCPSTHPHRSFVYQHTLLGRRFLAQPASMCPHPTTNSPLSSRTKLLPIPKAPSSARLTVLDASRGQGRGRRILSHIPTSVLTLNPGCYR